MAGGASRLGHPMKKEEADPKHRCFGSASSFSWGAGFMTNVISKRDQSVTELTYGVGVTGDNMLSEW